MTAVSVKNVWKEYNGRIVLENVSLEVEPHSFISLVGPSGCGKSTFLRMLLSAETPTKGAITVEGDALPGEPTADRGVVFQRYSVFPHLTVLENVVVGLEFGASPLLGKLFGKARKKAREEAAEILTAVGLGDFLHLYPAQLSGGMQQRLAIAQALIKKPRILLLDEPFGALDPGIRAEIHVLMLKLWRETKMTVFMVTHDLSEAFHLGTRVIAFDRPRNRPEERDRYGATITHDLAVWPPKYPVSDTHLAPGGTTRLLDEFGALPGRPGVGQQGVHYDRAG
jgi:NitT/TauT family transport system ATP-binding protein